MKANLLLILAVTLAFLFAVVIFACDDDEDTDDWEDDDDDEDDGNEDDDDTTDDDDGDDDDDDDDYGCEWAEDLIWFITECADLTDQDGNVMTTEEVLMDCNDCLGACSAGYHGDCDSAVACVCDNNCVDCG